MSAEPCSGCIKGFKCSVYCYFYRDFVSILREVRGDGRKGVLCR